MIKSPKAKTLADGLIERTSSMLNEIGIKDCAQRRKQNRQLIEEKEVRH